jgi:hypothetical protein
LLTIFSFVSMIPSLMLSFGDTTKMAPTPPRADMIGSYPNREPVIPMKINLLGTGFGN